MSTTFNTDRIAYELHGEMLFLSAVVRAVETALTAHIVNGGT